MQENFFDRKRIKDAPYKYVKIKKRVQRRVGKNRKLVSFEQTYQILKDEFKKKAKEKLTSKKRNKTNTKKSEYKKTRERMKNDKDFAFESFLLLQEHQLPHEQLKETKEFNLVGFNKPDSVFAKKVMKAIRESGGLANQRKIIGEKAYEDILNQIQARMIKYSNQITDILNDWNDKRNFVSIQEFENMVKTLQKIKSINKFKVKPSDAETVKKLVTGLRVEKFKEMYNLPDKAYNQTKKKIFIAKKITNPSKHFKNVDEQFDFIKKTNSVEIFLRMLMKKQPAIKPYLKKMGLTEEEILNIEKYPFKETIKDKEKINKILNVLKKAISFRTKKIITT